MANNKLTPQQDIATRQFFVLVAQRAEHDPSELAIAARICLSLLNYEVTANGRFIEKGSTVPGVYGTHPDELGGACEWLDDYKRAIKQGGKDARLNNKDSFTPGSGESPKDTKVW